MEGWVDLGYPAMHQPGVELAIFRSWVWQRNHYTTEPLACRNNIFASKTRRRTVDTEFFTAPSYDTIRNFEVKFHVKILQDYEPTNLSEVVLI